ncbi:MAG: MarR family winged helix-turn-helix transcriptional regulator [Rhodospirillaceae bacterium]
MDVKPASSGISAAALDPSAVLEVCLCHNIRRAARTIGRRYDAALASAGLTSGQFTILAAAAALSPLPLPVLREILAMDRTSLNRTLKPLERNGLIEINAGAGRRAGHIVLTAEGAVTFRDAGQLWRAAQADASQQLGAGRTGQFLSLLNGAATALHDQ